MNYPRSLFLHPASSLPYRNSTSSKFTSSIAHQQTTRSNNMIFIKMRFINTILAIAAIITVTIAGPMSCVPNSKCDEDGAITCGRLGRDTAVFKCVGGCWDPQAPFCLGQEHWAAVLFILGYWGREWKLLNSILCSWHPPSTDAPSPVRHQEQMEHALQTSNVRGLDPE
ncbi:hypothetical protein BDU57DRAFT_562380 [Ampelomyces quisqualis]|uniref:Uncharacterized protein n=1 Tax=Ampelomyces quisqualis TaxID=50730 RepID=A0A6A5QYW2_AMPQU|nr:hypothetical protein BDU57DRAFT_562380 [Ampelomyces quisqualis]